MKIYFSWIQPEQDLNNINCLKREDLKIFRMIISQKEGEIALAKLLVNCNNPILLQEAVIGYESEEKDYQILFKGYPLGMPRQTNGGLSEIEFSAKPMKAAVELDNLAKELKTTPFYDQLFIDPTRESPVDVLEARQALFYWDKKTGNLSLSDIFKGRRVFNLSNYILDNSFKMSLGDLPLDSVAVEVKAEWIQRAWGESNIFPKISASFSNFKFNTLTPEAILKSWPKIGDKIGSTNGKKQSGYRVTQSHIKVINPNYGNSNSTGGIGIYPTITPEFNKGNDAVPIRLRRSWLEGELWLEGIYKQRITEIARFTVDHYFQLKGHIPAKIKTIKLCLQKIEDYLEKPSQASFFKGPRGREALSHAIEVAKAHLAGTARYIKVEFMVPLDKGVEINVDDSVVLEGEFIPTQRLEGKVVEYRHEIGDGPKTAWICLAVAAGIKNELGIKLDSEIPTENLDIAFKETKTQHNCQINRLEVGDIIESIRVKNDGEEQIKMLLQCEQQDEPNYCPINKLQENTTKIDIELLDLRTFENLEKFIDFKGNLSWSGPALINIENPVNTSGLPNSIRNDGA